MPSHSLSCCLTFDVDAMSGWLSSPGQSSLSALSRGEFAAVALPRILKLLSKNDIRATFFVPGHTAYAFPRLIQAIVADGHEIGHHGWVHEDPSKVDADAQRRHIELGLEALFRTAGARPRGYRSPSWALTSSSIELLLEYEFLYDSSCMASDFFPYYLREGDRWSSDEPYVFGECVDLIELPVAWGLDDAPLFEFIPGFSQRMGTPADAEEIWKGDFDYAYRNCSGGLFTLTLHPEVVGRGHRMLMLERLVDYFKGHSGVAFESLGGYAELWKQEHQLEDWKRSGQPSWLNHEVEPSVEPPRSTEARGSS
jgi:peptidoglycan/xylan/chitin deacetylase (PgdA/CDA1 family)